MGKSKQKDRKNVRMLGHEKIEEYYLHGSGSKRKKHLDKHDEDRERGRAALASSIYSRRTGKDYRENWNRYCDAMRDADFRVDGHRPRTLEEAALFMPQYLEMLGERQGRFGRENLSAWTVRTYFAAPAKVLGLRMQDFDLPERRREDILRSREDRQAKDFSRDNNWEIIEFQQCVGLRNFKEFQRLKGSDLILDGDKAYVRVQNGKGGRPRDTEILGTPDQVRRIVDRMQAAGNSAVWESVPKHYDMHRDRAYYACKVYLQHERPIETLTRKQRYDCRKDLKGTSYDREAMQQASFALGHSRIDVIAQNYLWRLEEVRNDLYFD